MKNIQTILIAAGLLFLVVGCNKENASIESPDESVVPAELVTEIIKADTKEDKTKADINADAEFTWTVGDLLAVHVSNGDSHKYVVTTGGADAAAAEAAFTVQYESGYTRDGFAVYPSSIVEEEDANYGQTSSPLRVKLPDEYTLAQVSGTRTPCPMIAVNAPESNWAFKQLCAMLRVTLNNIPPSTEYIKLTFGHNVAGYFNIPVTVKAGESVIAYANASGSNSTTIKITDLGLTTEWMDGQDINIPIPTGTYTTNSVIVEAYDEEDNVILSMTRPLRLAGDWTASRKSARKIVASLPAFSISDDKRVVIAGSNLQATKTSDTWATYSWSFMEYPWSQVETSAVTENYSGLSTISLFGWGTSGYNYISTDGTWTNYMPYSTSNATDPAATMNPLHYGPIYGGTNMDLINANGIDYSRGDWGVNASTTSEWGDTGLSGYNPLNRDAERTNGTYAWRVLTNEEWLYLFGMKVNESSIWGHRRYEHFGRATVNGVVGIVLIPDKFCDPKTNSSVSSPNTPSFDRGQGTLYTSNVYSSTSWNSMALAGAVFLPASGKRNGTAISDVGSEGNYWSSSAYKKEPYVADDADGAFKLRFVDTSSYGNKVRVWPSNAATRKWGLSVRLVREL